MKHEAFLFSYHLTDARSYFNVSGLEIPAPDGEVFVDLREKMELLSGSTNVLASRFSPTEPHSPVFVLVEHIYFIS